MYSSDEPEIRDNLSHIRPELQKLSVEQGLCIEIREVLEKHFSINPHMSPVSFAYKIQLQDRRIFELLDKQNEKPPTLTEIIAILSNIYTDRSIGELARELPGRIGDYLRDEYWCLLGSGDYSFSADLIDPLKRKENYIIYKLAANRSGVSFKEIQRLFGTSGVENAKYMLRRGLLDLQGNKVFATTRDFSLPNDMFRDCFKFTADYISTDPDRKHDNTFANLSESLSEEAYQKVVDIQRRALKEILEVLADPSSQGEIPTFVIAAADILE